MNKTIPVREGEALDAAMIDSIMQQHFSDLSGSCNIEQFSSGHSNLTYSLTYKDRSFVLRRPPFGTKPKSGHSMIREYRVMKALKPVFGSVPDCYFHMTAENSPLGAEFYVMELVTGCKLDKKIPSEWNFAAEDSRGLCLAFFQKLIDLHKVDYRGIGLEDFGQADGYVKRQITGWNDRFVKALTDDVEDFKDVRDWLVATMPEKEVGHAICHGDYRLDNVILDQANPQHIKTILDWEISAIGDPLMDLGNTLAYWIEPNDPDPIKATAMQPSMADGMLSRAEICDLYAKATGYDLSKFAFYHVYGVFRLAVIVQQIYYRYYHGQTQNKTFARFGQMANILGNYARRLIEQSKL